MVDESTILAHGIGIVKLFPSLSIDNVLYVLGSPFNLLSIISLTCSLDCVISFNQRFCLFTGPKFRTNDWHRMWVSWSLSSSPFYTY